MGRKSDQKKSHHIWREIKATWGFWSQEWVVGEGTVPEPSTAQERGLQPPEGAPLQRSLRLSRAQLRTLREANLFPRTALKISESSWGFHGLLDLISGVSSLPFLWLSACLSQNTEYVCKSHVGKYSFHRHQLIPTENRERQSDGRNWKWVEGGYHPSLTTLTP